MDAADAESAEAIKVENKGRIDFLQLRSVEILCWPSFFVFFRFLPELSRPKALRKIEGRWMSGGHPFSADRSGTERCLR